MSVESLFSSETKIQILRTLSGGNRSFSAQELERETTKNRAAVYKALESLKNESALKEIKTEGKTGYYRLNLEKDIMNQVELLFEEEKRNYRAKNVPNKVLNILFNLKQKLVNQIENLEKIILFGSTARGDYTSNSDIDLYIVVKKLEKETEDRIYEIADSYDHDFSLIMRSEEDYRSEFEKPVSNLADSIIKDGFITLYGFEDEIIQKQIGFSESVEAEEK